MSRAKKTPAKAAAEVPESEADSDGEAAAACRLAGRTERPRLEYSRSHGNGYFFPDRGGWDGKSFVPRAAARAAAKAAKLAATAAKPAGAKPAGAKPAAVKPAAAKPAAAKPAVAKPTAEKPARNAASVSSPSAIRAAPPSFGDLSEQQLQELCALLNSIS